MDKHEQEVVVVVVGCARLASTWIDAREQIKGRGKNGPREDLKHRQVPVLTAWRNHSLRNDRNDRITLLQCPTTVIHDTNESTPQHAKERK